MPKRLSIEVPTTFSFGHTVQSHGWYDLEPFALDETTMELSYVFRDRASGEIASGLIGQSGDSVTVRLSKNMNSRPVIRDVRHILRLDDDIGEFYEMAEREEGLQWASRNRAGRLLRSPTVFEDLVKTMCTTNCSWGLTRKMVANLVQSLGEPDENGRRAFPTPEAMASAGPDFYRNEVRAGYRSPYFAELAEGVAVGRFDPESWLDPDLPTDELKKRIKSVKGIGDYAAENMLKLLGRYDGLALDSWLRAKFSKKHNKGRPCTDKKIEKHYSKFGKWRGLAIWCDMTADWFEKER